MKELNSKQLAWSRKVVFADKFKKMLLLWALVFSVFAVNAAVSYVQGDKDAGIVSLLTGAGSAQFAMSMAFANVGDIDDQSDLYTQGTNIAWEIKLVHTSQIDRTVEWPYPDDNRQVADIPLLDGQYPLTFGCHNNPTYNATGEKGDYTIDPTKTMDFVLANTYRNQVLNFCENFAGGKFIVFFRKVETSTWYILGTYDKPMNFKSYEIKNDDASVALCKFENKSVRQFYEYIGSLDSEAGITLTADATNLAIESNAKYYTNSANTAATVLATVSSIAPADVDRNITIYGGGGTYPTTIADNTAFILKGDETWTGTSGSRITFKILDTGTLVEQERIQA